jgi:hypothetical protein
MFSLAKMAMMMMMISVTPKNNNIVRNCFQRNLLNPEKKDVFPPLLLIKVSIDKCDPVSVCVRAGVFDMCIYVMHVCVCNVCM